MEHILWERASGTKLLTEDEIGTVTKMTLYPYPVLKEDIGHLFQYPMDTEMAFICPLFAPKRGQVNNEHAAHILTELLTKSAMYLAKTLLTHTDMRASGVPFYFVVSEEHYAAYKLYFDFAGIPETAILKFKQSVYEKQMEEKRLARSMKFECLYHAGLREFEKIVWWDADIHVFRLEDQEPRPICQQLLDAWGEEAWAIPNHLQSPSPMRDYHPSVHRMLGRIVRRESEKIDTVFQQLSELTGYSPEFLIDHQKKPPYDIAGFAQGFSRSIIDNPEFIEFTRNCYEIEGPSDCDETICELYLLKHFYEAYHPVETFVLDATDIFGVLYNTPGYLQRLKTSEYAVPMHMKK